MMLGALAKWGIVPKFYKSDWRTHNRNAAQGWGPLYGLVVHNFGSDTSDPNSLAYLYGGDLTRGMPGPLSQFAITDDGTLWVIGWGAANHTGSMDPRLLDLVKHDSAPLAADFRPNVNFNSPGTVHNINDNFVGVEMTYGAAPTAAQRATVAKLGAALMDLFGTGYTGGSVVGHREATTDRSDPVGFQMWQLRRDINALLAPKPPTPPAVVPVPPKQENPPMTVNSADVARIWHQDGLLPAPGSPTTGNTHWAPSTYLYSTKADTLALRAEVADLKATLAKVLAAVTKP
jgi:hypothetical protein